MKIVLIRGFILISLFLWLSPHILPAQALKNKNIYAFCYFKNNGQDGLHLAYSLDGLHWTALNSDSSFLQPMVAKDKLMRDPCIIKGGDSLFHMVWTVSWKDKGIGYASSKDLIHWSEQEFIPVMAHEATAQNCWAPEIFYDAPTRQYMIYWATTIPGLFPATDTTGDNGANHRIYYTLTKDFKSFSKAAILYNQNFNVIDATIQKINNQYIMFLKDETKKPPQKNIRITISNELTEGYGKASEPITGNYWAEGPTVMQLGEEWIVYFDKYREHQYGAMASKDLKNWTDISSLITVPAGIRHGTIFKLTQTELDTLLKYKK